MHETVRRCVQIQESRTWWFQLRHGHKEHKAVLEIYPSVKISIVAWTGKRKEKGRRKTANRKIFCKYGVNSNILYFPGRGLEWQKWNYQTWTSVVIHVEKLLIYKHAVHSECQKKKETKGISDLLIRFLKYPIIFNLLLLSLILDSGFKYPVSNIVCHFSQ